MNEWKVFLQQVIRRFGYGLVRTSTLDALNAQGDPRRDGHDRVPLEEPPESQVSEKPLVWRHLEPPVAPLSGRVTQRMARYEQAAGAAHRAGSLQLPVVDEIENAMPPNPKLTVETGCGKSTILFSCLSEKHIAFTLDDRNEENSSVQYFLNSEVSRSDRVEFVFGPTQSTLLAHEFREPIDAALIDGPHGFPFPQLEYWRLYPHIRPGGILIIDDVHIRHIGDMFRFLASEDMWEYVAIVGGSTGILRRTSAPIIFPTGDQWWDQPYNTGAFPSMLLHDRPSLTVDSQIEFANSGNSHLFTLFGWARSEEWGRWAISKESMLAFLWHGPIDSDLILALHAGDSSDVSVFLNDVLLGTIGARGSRDPTVHRLKIQAGLLRERDGNRLSFRPLSRVMDTHQPPRAIGIALRRVVIERDRVSAKDPGAAAGG